MTTSNRNPPTGSQQPTSQRKLAAVGIGGAGALMVLCCLLGPLLLAGGALGVLGAVAGNPLVIGAAVILLGTGIAAFVLRRQRRRTNDEPCCPSPGEPTNRR